MLNNLFSLKTDFTTIYLIKEEVELFNSIDKNLIDNFKKILCKINNRKIDFQLSNNNFDEQYLLSFLDNQKKNFYPLDYKNIWSNYNFFLNYFEFSDFKFNIKIFQNIHLKLNRYSALGKINKLLHFLPFILIKPNKKNKSFFYKYFPSILLKDAAFAGKKCLMGSYCYHYKKTKFIKKGIREVIKNLDDELSKKNYDILLNKNTETNWQNYFNKATKNFQYSDYIKLDENSVIINCGVENGMELKLFNGVSEIYNIDPGKDNYLDKSVEYLLKNSKTKQHFIEYALYTNKNIYTELEENKKFEVKKLTDIIKEYNIKKISLIKSDIEGAERLMVDDLIQICTKYNSQLAISIYHTNHDEGEDEKLLDLVNIPLKLIKALRHNYNFYFNNYSYERWEGILYCIPKSL